MSPSDDSSKYSPIAWNPEVGYAKPPTKMDVPRTAAGAGSQMGLSVILDANVNEYYCSSTDSSGFKILLHNPNETPKLANMAFFVSTGEETRVEVRPRISDATEHIRKVQIRHRQCVFASEANLSYFRWNRLRKP
jgi:acid-sensing ion channel, other